MKKIYLMLTMALMCVLSVTANAQAGGYDGGVNSYTSNKLKGAKTAVIYKGNYNTNTLDTDNIYYVGQSKSTDGFSNLELMMKADAPAGEYTMIVEGGGKTTFKISEAHAVVWGTTKLEFLGAERRSDGSYSAAYGLGVKNLLNSTSKLTMITKDKAYTTDVSEDSSIINWGAGLTYVGDEIMFVIQVDEIGENYIITDESGSIAPDFELYYE